MASRPLRLAMWSGPRNISTALMRSFGSRSDTVVCDEPLYAHYLATTAVVHPGRDEIVAHGEVDWRRVAATLTGPLPDGASVFYQKHMAHHLLPSIERDWLAGLEHAFLIRDPREMLLSLVKVTPNPTLEDTGLPQQVELFEAVRARTGRTPPVIDARDVLTSPEPLLRRLCAAVGLDFDPAMMAWEPGPRATDGVWAKHWYAEVERSTGFAPWRPREGRPEGALADVLEQCQEPYRTLHRQRL